MASGSFRQVEVLCPFYREDDGSKRIRCEGLVDDSCIDLKFIFRKDYEKQITTFCCDKYKKCEVYKMLMKKYDEE